MVDEGANPEDAAEVLLSKARKGAAAEGARGYFGDYLWARLWKAVTGVANCPPELNTMLMFRAEIHTCMKMAQDMQLDLANAEIAVKRIKALFSTKPVSS